MDTGQKGNTDDSVLMGVLDQLKFDQSNANKGTEYGNHLLRKSISTFGVGRGIVVANDGTIIGGNQTVSMLAELGIENVVIVPTDGNTLVVTQRTDIAPGSKAFHELALADNRVGQVNLDFDMNVLTSLSVDFDIDLDDWGFKVDTEPDNEEQTTPTPKVNAMTFKLTASQMETIEKALETARIEGGLDADSDTEPLMVIVNEYLSRRR